MKAIILAGGLGTRISEETVIRPKPMIEIGGMPVDGDRILAAIEITNQRHPFGTIESAAIGYFIIGNTRQPGRAYPYFAHAIQTAKDPTFGPGIIEELRKDGHAEMADKLESLGQGHDTEASEQR